MKIALYVPSWPPGDTPNGIVIYASQLVPALRRLGHEVFVLTPDKKTGDADPYTVDLRGLASVPTFWHRAMFKLMPPTAGVSTVSFALATAISRLVEKHKFDVIEMEETFGLNLAISRLNLLPVVVRLHGPWFLNGRFNDPDEIPAQNYHRSTLECRGIRHAQFVTAPSAEVLQSVKDHYRLTLLASRVIPNPIEATVGSKAWNLEACNKDSLLYVGRFDRRKGGDLVLRAFAEIAASYPQLTLTFIGPDRGIVQADGKVWNFEHFLRSNFPDWCRSRIKFRGQMKHSEVMSLRPMSFATIIASQYEIMPYSVLEAMSLGCPLVATAVGGITEMIQDQRNGLLVPSQDVTAMVSACKKLLDDRVMAAQIGRQALQDCQDLYEPERIAKETVSAYQEAIDRFKTGVVRDATSTLTHRFKARVRR